MQAVHDNDKFSQKLNYLISNKLYLMQKLDFLLQFELMSGRVNVIFVVILIY